MAKKISKKSVKRAEVTKRPAVADKKKSPPAARKSTPKRPTVVAKDKPAVSKRKPAAVPVAVTKSGVGAKVVASAKPGKVKIEVDPKGLDALRNALVRMRERLTGQISALSDDSLKYIDDQSSEDRTDDFDREFALNLVSSEQDSIYEIDEALRRIKERSYGLCAECGSAIEKARLLALPFARMCIRCQSETERGRARFRPFGETITQGVESVQEAPEAEETE